MGMELGREGQLQVNNCYKYYCSAWSKLNSEIGLNTHPPTTHLLLWRWTGSATSGTCPAGGGGEGGSHLYSDGS